jgi:prepilin-type N-terminal cleavage/methylation domain-containing protein
VRPRQTPAGFSLVEVMVATVLLSAVALAVTQILVRSMEVRAQSERSMQAIQLAVEGLEQLRAGHTLRSLPASAGFKRSANTAAWSVHPGVQRLEVTVSWDDGKSHSFRLTTLANK